MENKIAKVKKYKSVLNFIIASIISLLLSFALFVFFRIGSHAQEIDLFFYIDLALSIIVFIGLFIKAIKTFKKQRNFNKNKIDFYIEVFENELIIKNKKIKFEDIKSISFTKISTWEIFGEIQEKNYGYYPIPFFKFEERIAQEAAKNGIKNHRKALEKSNLGNILIELNDSSIKLKRVDNIEETINKLNDIVKNKKETK